MVLVSILIIFCLIIAGFTFLKAYRKVITLIFALFSVILMIWFFKNLGIEDYYANNNHIYFDGKENDIIVMTDKINSQFIAKGQIQRKTWNRIFVKTDNDTLDLKDWIEKKAGYMVEVNCELK